MRDDRILPFTRALASVVTAILVTAWVVLYLWLYLVTPVQVPSV